MNVLVKKSPILLMTLLMALLPALLFAQSSNTYLPAEEMSTPQSFLPGPPELQDARFYADWVAYRQGMDIRSAERGYRAIDDANTSVEYFMLRFGEAMGVNMTPENCPNIARYISRTFSTAKLANSKAKDYYARVRPYNQFHEDTPIKWSQNPSDNTSYPSGHTCRAWSTALALVAIDPAHQNEILKTGFDYGQSRVILGYHYQSDIDAARLVASAGVARMMGEKSFQEDMEAARTDLEILRNTASPRIRTLIVGGNGSRAWDIRTIAIARTLRSSGLFSVDIAGPAECADSIGFGSFELVILKTGGDSFKAGWSDATKASFEEYCGGVIYFHDADNESDSKGIEKKEHILELRDAGHPVTAGLPSQWKHAEDAFLDNTTGMKKGTVADLKNADVLYAVGKTPVIYTTSNGKNKGFHIRFCYVGESVEKNPSMQCTGFQTLLLRGAEWCATGKVSQAVPSDFPTADDTSSRKDYRPHRSLR